MIAMQMEQPAERRFFWQKLDRRKQVAAAQTQRMKLPLVLLEKLEL